MSLFCVCVIASAVRYKSAQPGNERALRAAVFLESRLKGITAQLTVLLGMQDRACRGTRRVWWDLAKSLDAGEAHAAERAAAGTRLSLPEILVRKHIPKTFLGSVKGGFVTEWIAR